jgi:hypothetical protein
MQSIKLNQIKQAQAQHPSADVAATKLQKSCN